MGVSGIQSNNAETPYMGISGIPSKQLRAPYGVSQAGWVKILQFGTNNTQNVANLGDNWRKIR